MVVVLGLTMTAAVTGLENGVGGLLAPLEPDLILSQSGPRDDLYNTIYKFLKPKNYLLVSNQLLHQNLDCCQ